MDPAKLAYAELRRCMTAYQLGRITRWEMVAALALWQAGLRRELPTWWFPRLHERLDGGLR